MSNGKTSSKAPLIIIGVVLIGVFVFVWFLMNRKPATPQANANRPANASSTSPTNAPLGAQPPNMLGSPNATVTIEEFADFQCGACAGVHPKVKEITSQYGSRIKFIFRNYPLQIAAHDKAYDAAVATEAAGLQGRFWDMQHLLFTNQQAWTSNPDYRKLWEGYAAQIGLDVERFKNDMAGLTTKGRVNADLQRGRALNVSSTPTIFINGNSVPFTEMTPETLRKIIDGELAKATPAQSSSNPASNSAPAETKK
jgi:protein-disulfide isomerase